ncbi:MAG TPA: hypothetical protein VJU77_09005 [Chthoniobacterales bacterium]|nr:hypothetical protein [Chthoniobacterales bacterium]
MKQTQHSVFGFQRRPSLTSKCWVAVIALSIASLANAQDPTPTPPNDLAAPPDTKIGRDLHAPLPATSPDRDSHPDTYWADVKRAADDALAAGRQTQILYSVYRADEFREASKDVSASEASKRLREGNRQLASGYINRLPLHVGFVAANQEFDLSVGWRRPSPPGIYLQINFELRVKNRAEPSEKPIYVDIRDAQIPKWLQAYVYYTEPGRPPDRSFAVVFYVLHSM